MKIVFYTLLFVPLWLRAQSTTIVYEITNAKDSIYILGHHLDDQRIIFDTLKNTNDGVLNISSEESIAPGLYFIYGPSSQFYQEFFLNEDEFKITTDGTFENTFTEKSFENEVFFRFQNQATPIQREIFNLNEQFKSSPEDSLEIIDKIRKAERALKALRAELTTAHPQLLVSKMLRLLDPVELDEEKYEGLDESQRQKRRYADYKNKFRDRLDLQEPGLIRTPVFKRSVMKYMTEVIPQIPDSIVNELDDLLTDVASDSASFRYWLINFTNHYQNAKLMGMQAVLVHLLDRYYLSGKATWIEETARVKMEQEVRLMRPNQIGKIAPPLTLIDTANRSLSPLKLSQEYLVLYFYDPDCGVCKKKTPILKSNYEEIKGLGAEVVAINIASEADKWKDYIKENKLDWINLGDPHYRSDFREKYNIKSTPFLYILDKERKIIARKLGVDQVVSFLSDYKAVISQDIFD